MALTEGVENIAANVRFHLSLRGGTAKRFAYLAVYYFIFLLFRWGDRHLRPLVWLERLGLARLPVVVTTEDGQTLAMDLHTAFDPLFSIRGRGDYGLEGFAPEAGQTVIDAGANVGIYSAWAAARVGPSGTVVSVEPHPGNAAVLRGNLGRNGLSRARVVEAALSDRSGRMELYLHEKAINHSLVRPAGKSTTVRVLTLDELVEEEKLARVDLIKIDTEGNTREILKGAAKTLARWRPKLTLEYEAADEAAGLPALLKSLGYDLEVIGGIGYAAARAAAGESHG